MVICVDSAVAILSLVFLMNLIESYLTLLAEIGLNLCQQRLAVDWNEASIPLVQVVTLHWEWHSGKCWSSRVWLNFSHSHALLRLYNYNNIFNCSHYCVFFLCHVFLNETYFISSAILLRRHYALARAERCCKHAVQCISFVGTVLHWCKQQRQCSGTATTANRAGLVPVKHRLRVVSAGLCRGRSTGMPGA